MTSMIYKNRCFTRNQIVSVDQALLEIFIKLPCPFRPSFLGLSLPVGGAFSTFVRVFCRTEFFWHRGVPFL